MDQPPTSDSALDLKMSYDRGVEIDPDKAKDALDTSTLIESLLQPVPAEPFVLLNRLNQLTEIPFTTLLPQANSWAEHLLKSTYCGHGFSHSGKSDDLLACYNAMITTVLIRFGYGKSEEVKSGVQWILDHQSVDRQTVCHWTGKGIQKYGGCMKQTPCYIGVVKSMIALSTYRNTIPDGAGPALDDKLTNGLEYLLSHQVYLRHNDDQPITKDIIKLAYPFTYKTNIIEILRLLKENSLHDDERCAKAIEWLDKKRKKNSYWQVNSVHHPKHWVQFDQPGTSGQWVTYEIQKLLDRT